MMTSRNEIKNHRTRNIRPDDVLKARAASPPRIAYSAKCASLRVMECASARFSSLICGKSHLTSGPMILEVLLAENSAVEAKKINAIQKSNGSYRQMRLRPL